MTPSDAVIHVDALDHQAQPTTPTAAERRGLALALIAAAALHVIIPAVFLLYGLLAPHPAPPLQEVPVELVQEPPPPPPEPKKEPPPTPPPSPDDEKPAYDAPSAATQEKANRESKEEKSQAPKTEAQPDQQAGAPPPSEHEQAAPKQTAAAPPPPAEAAPAPDADQSAAPPSPQPSEADAAPPAPKVDDKPTPPPAPPVKAPPGVPIPEPMEMPEPKFAHAATESPVISGNADTRYFTIVYGMIRNHMHDPQHGTPPAHSGAIVFTVDEGGNLVERRVMRSSGSQSLDLAVMAAIAQAAPYPPPPGWQPRSMRLTYGK